MGRDRRARRTREGSGIDSCARHCNCKALELREVWKQDRDLSENNR